MRICPRVSLALQLMPLVQQFLKASGRLVSISHSYLFNDQASAKEELYAFLEPIVQYQQLLSQFWYSFGWHELKSWFLPATFFAARTVIEYKLSSYLGKLFSRAEKTAWDIFKKGFKSAHVKTVLAPCKAFALVSEKQGKGVLKRVQEPSKRKTRNSLGGKRGEPHRERYSLPKAENLDQFFELPFGKKLKNKSKPRIVYKGNKPIKAYEVFERYGYFKKNYIYYLDTMHKDHLEVYLPTGCAKGVVNLDGTWNSIKSEKVKGRTIKI